MESREWRNCCKVKLDQTLVSEIIDVILKLDIFVEVTANHWEEVLEIPIRKYTGRCFYAYLAPSHLPLPSPIGQAGRM